VLRIITLFLGVIMTFTSPASCYGALIFDMGSTLVPSKKEFFLSTFPEYCGVEREVLSQYLTNEGRPLKRKLSYGTVTFELFWEHLSDHCDISIPASEAREQWISLYEQWFIRHKAFSRQRILRFCGDTKPPPLLCVLSNTSELVFEAAYRADLFEGFDDDLVIGSFQVHSCKPEDAIFNTLITRLASKGIAPSKCLFIDNKSENTATAALKGFNIHTFSQ
jgi:FMN phosphatase YigB (HAD superfamily)